MGICRRMNNLTWLIKLSWDFQNRHNSADSVHTFNLVCIKMASILSSLSRDLKNCGSFSNHYEVIILSMKSPARLEDHVYKIFIDEIDFYRLIDRNLKVVFSLFRGVLHGKSADFPAKNVKCRSISSYAIQPRD